ncbi:hypothetical protein [Thermopirellula anaerolimosa]
MMAEINEHHSSRPEHVSRRAVLSAGGAVAASVLLGRLLESPAFAEESKAVTPGNVPRPWLKYARKDAFVNDPRVFDQMLEAMSDGERASLAQALQMLPKIPDRDFASFGLLPYWEYPAGQRPKTYNEVSADIVLNAIEKGAVDRDLISPKSIRNQFLWVSSSIFTYPTKSGVYYHDLVKWVAGKYGVSDADVKSLATFDLERKILEVSFKDLWDKLDQKGRLKVLEAIEKKSGTTVGDKAAIAALGGAGALAALSATVAFTGFAFYTTMSVVISTAAGILGITLPFAAYMGASSTVAVLAGPVGWVIAGVLATAGIVFLTRANYRKSAAFILALHLLKAEAYHEAGEL